MKEKVSIVRCEDYVQEKVDVAVRECVELIPKFFIKKNLGAQNIEIISILKNWTFT